MLLPLCNYTTMGNLLEAINAIFFGNTTSQSAGQYKLRPGEGSESMLESSIKHGTRCEETLLRRGRSTGAKLEEILCGT
jgi:hypothetical protein